MTLPASNTKECFSYFIGQKVIGFLEQYNTERGKTSRILIFENGEGLTLFSNGTYWIESKNIIDKFVDQKRKELKEVEIGLKNILAVAEGPVITTKSEN